MIHHAVTAFPDTAFHTPFKAEPNVGIRNPLCLELHKDVPVHDGRAASGCKGVPGMDVDLREEGRNHTHIALPIIISLIDG